MQQFHNYANIAACQHNTLFFPCEPAGRVLLACPSHGYNSIIPQDFHPQRAPDSIGVKPTASKIPRSIPHTSARKFGVKGPSKPADAIVRCCLHYNPEENFCTISLKPPCYVPIVMKIWCSICVCHHTNGQYRAIYATCHCFRLRVQ